MLNTLRDKDEEACIEQVAPGMSTVNKCGFTGTLWLKFTDDYFMASIECARTT